MHLLPLHRLARLSLFALAFICSASASFAALAFQTGRNDYNITVGGRSRHFIVHVPAGVTASTPTAVVVMIHGTSGQGEDMYLQSGWVEKANTERFLAVFPSSLAYNLVDEGERTRTTKWNHSDLHELLLDPSEVPADDEQFIKAMLFQIDTTWNVDRRRVFAHGFSNGAQFVNTRLMMTMPDIFSAFASNGIGPDLSGVFPVSGNISFYLLNGTHDDRLITGYGVPQFPMDAAALLAPNLFGQIIPNRVLPRLQLANIVDEVPGEPDRFTTLVYNDRLVATNTNEFRFRMVENLAHRIPDFAPDLFWTFFLSHTGAAAPLVGPPVISTHPRSQTVTTGRSVTLITTVGSGTPPSFQWQFNGTDIAGATASSYTIASTAAAHAGNYTVRVSNPAGSVVSSPAALTVSPPAWLSNISVRTAFTAGQSPVIVGFVVNGGSDFMLLRAAGPSLANHGVTTPMADPRIDLYQETTKLTDNNDWPATLATAFARTGAFAFPAGSKDAALERYVSGNLSLHASGTTGGVLLVEGYDSGANSTARLLNVSARNRVGTGQDILVAGFEIQGTGTLRLLIRGIGPGLVQHGVPNTLADPKLEYFSGSGAKLGENDNWNAALAPTFESVGAFALTPGSRDAALVVTLNAGENYSVAVSGIGNTTGEGLIEIYALP